MKRNTVRKTQRQFLSNASKPGLIISEAILGFSSLLGVFFAFFFPKLQDNRLSHVFVQVMT